MISSGLSMTSAFGKEWFERWLRGMIISYIRKDYVWKKRPTKRMVASAINRYIKNYGTKEEVISILKEIKGTPQILPTIPSHIKKEKITEIEELLEA